MMRLRRASVIISLALLLSAATADAKASTCCGATSPSATASTGRPTTRSSPRKSAKRLQRRWC